ncbi:unnamed protein product [Adineta steineri]|uniref:Uncharacterized protein n=1 Tax=Adineta steineri TaxID=433720 RepID=A0A819QF99_9BILA|nr:unnamed protein product [Adineta steineri]CAF4028571.1 unnamed protein product [Adineta steineri]
MRLSIPEVFGIFQNRGIEKSLLASSFTSPSTSSSKSSSKISKKKDEDEDRYYRRPPSTDPQLNTISTKEEDQTGYVDDSELNSTLPSSLSKGRCETRLLIQSY